MKIFNSSYKWESKENLSCYISAVEETKNYNKGLVSNCDCKKFIKFVLLLLFNKKEM